MLNTYSKLVVAMEEIVWADRRKVLKSGTSHVVALPKEYFSPGERLQLKLYKDGDDIKLVITKLPSE